MNSRYISVSEFYSVSHPGIDSLTFSHALCIIPVLGGTGHSIVFRVLYLKILQPHFRVT